MDERVLRPAAEVLACAAEDLRALVGARLGIVADQPEHAAQARFAGRRGDRIDAAFRARAGVADGGESTAQRLERGELRRHMHELVVEATLERHPDPAKDLGRLAERERLAERLRQVVVRIDEPRHQQFARQLDGREVRVALDYPHRRAYVGEGSVPDDDGVARLRSVAQQHLIGNEQLFARLQAFGRQIAVHGIGSRWRHCESGVPAGLISGTGAAGGGVPATRLRLPRWWKRMFNTIAVKTPIARPLPSRICALDENWL